MSATPLPAAFLARVAQILPSSEMADFAAAMARPLRKSIRVNTLKISVAEFCQLTQPLGWTLTPIPWCATGFWIDRVTHRPPLGKTWLHAAGLFYIQEASSMLPPEMLAVAPGQRVLDVAAAPGSKTTQLAGLLAERGLLVANEVSGSRVKALASNLERAAVNCAALTQRDGRVFEKYTPNFFDRILLDAPCSGEGTARKDPLALANFSVKRIAKMATLQISLLTAAVHALAPGGRVAYSTCTLAPEENEAVVATVLQKFGGHLRLVPLPEANGLTEFAGVEYGAALAGTRRIWPHRQDCEGFFVAVLEKLAPTTAGVGAAESRRGAVDLRVLKPREASQLLESVATRFGVAELQLPAGAELAVRGEEVWLLPPQAFALAARLKLARAGTQLFWQRRGELSLTHAGANFLGVAATRQVVELNEVERDEYLAGRDLTVASAATGEVIVRHAGYVLGGGTLASGRLKNRLPRHFVVAN